MSEGGAGTKSQKGREEGRQPGVVGVGRKEGGGEGGGRREGGEEGA